MIWIVLLVCIALIGIGCYIFENSYNFEFLGSIMVVVGALGGVIAGVIAISLVFEVADLAVIDERIAMYTEENAAIERQIEEVVKQYQAYEKEVFTEVSPENSVALVSLYPELKSDTLVQEQINVYVENDKKIKELKEDEILGRVMKWWLYFGGKEKGGSE